MALWEMCYGKHPYAGISYGELYARQQQQERPTIDDSVVPAKLREVIRACWQFDPSERPAASIVVDTLRGISTLENKSGVPQQRTEEVKEEVAPPEEEKAKPAFGSKVHCYIYKKKRIRKSFSKFVISISVQLLYFCLIYNISLESPVLSIIIIISYRLTSLLKTFIWFLYFISSILVLYVSMLVPYTIT